MTFPSVTTKLVFLLGYPLGHSVSPAMHNHVFNTLSMDYCYLPVEVTPENLGPVFTGLSKINTGGFNVTIPHKIAILEYLDEIDPLAEKIGAVNTICLNNGKTKGYNTDGKGFVQSLEKKGNLAIQGKNIFILGCGGAVRAIAMTLAFRGARHIYICNRTQSKAEQLAGEINEKIAECTTAVEQVKSSIAKYLETCDVLINGTQLGMHPHTDTSPIDGSLLFSHLVVADIVYNPLKTRLLRDAEQRGCITVDGLGMLVYQGAAAFSLWTGKTPLISEMKTIAYDLVK
ncbi:shikimate dehydrogenase (NADP(+)) [Desulfomarina profundi]|uniref:Shikimate dehydrogenase (NADP(+)) n=1 Tax=Desulfomarina profundi TaxID=2772557 RepID=A0A8D5FDX3_9BACT|nr:shikimate dehydrogenase [Desulfomarina profundi]BCL59503.1 shikimate dehydrogenase (NADP(+)) [Desulfomarina profundi]